MGAVFDDRRWIQYAWPEDFILNADPSIEFLEMYTLTAVIITWSEEECLNYSRITIFCDNEAVVHIVNKMASSCKQCMKLVGILSLDGIKHNWKIYVRHIISWDNILSDALSRLDYQRILE